MMFDRLRLIEVNTDGTYTEQGAEVGDKFIRGKRNGHTVTITRQCVFPKDKPKSFDSIEDLLSAETPDVPLDPSLRRCVVAGFNDVHSVRFDRQELDDTLFKEAKALMFARREAAAYEGHSKFARQELQTKIMMVLGIGCAVVACVLGAIMAFEALVS